MPFEVEAGLPVGETAGDAAGELAGEGVGDAGGLISGVPVHAIEKAAATAKIVSRADLLIFWMFIFLFERPALGAVNDCIPVRFFQSDAVASPAPRVNTRMTGQGAPRPIQLIERVEKTLPGHRRRTRNRPSLAGILKGDIEGRAGKKKMACSG